MNDDYSSCVFVSYEDELKKMYTLLCSLDNDKVDVIYMKEKLLRAINQVPVILYPQTEKRHKEIWKDLFE